MPTELERRRRRRRTKSIKVGRGIDRCMEQYEGMSTSCHYFVKTDHPRTQQVHLLSLSQSLRLPRFFVCLTFFPQFESVFEQINRETPPTKNEAVNQWCESIAVSVAQLQGSVRNNCERAKNRPISGDNKQQVLDSSHHVMLVLMLLMGCWKISA
jgi:hypothetical protein